MIDFIEDVLMGIVRFILALVLGIVLVAACTLLARFYGVVIEFFWNWGR